MNHVLMPKKYGAKTLVKCVIIDVQQMQVKRNAVDILISL